MKYLFIIPLFCLSGSLLASYPPEALKRLPQQQLWLNTDNAAALRDTAVNRTEISASGILESGAYRLPCSPSGKREINLSSEGYHRTGSLSLYGKMNYEVGAGDNMRWKYELLASPRNPFSFADSVAGHYDTERFAFDAALAGSPAGGAFDYGIRVTYRTESSAKNRDPRPLINGVRYSIRPGIAYKRKGWRAGLSLHAERYGEDIKVSLLDHLEVQRYFLFMGLGHAHRELATEVSRDCSGENRGGSLQIGYENEKRQQLINLKFLSIKEGGTLGSAANPFKSGDYASQEMALLYLFKHYDGNRRSGCFRLALSRYDDRGLWYNQKLDPLKHDPPEWVVFNKSVKWTRQTENWQTGYLYMKERQGGRDYTVGLSASFQREKEEAYPNHEKMEVRNLTLYAGADKTIYFRQRNKLLVESEWSWRKNLSKEAQFGDIMLKEEISHPLFGFRSANYIHSKISITFARSYHSALYPFLRAAIDYKRVMDDNNRYATQNRTRYEIAFGLLF